MIRCFKMTLPFVLLLVAGIGRADEDYFDSDGVQIHYLDAPPVRDNPEATLLVQVQGVIAEY